MGMILHVRARVFVKEKRREIVRMSKDIPRGGGGVLGSSFAGYVPLASQNPYPITVYSVANYRPILVTFEQMSL